MIYFCLYMVSAIASWQSYKEICVASVYGFKNDKYAQRALACTGKKIKLGDFGVAHRTLRCGTLVRIKNLRTKRIVVAAVMDRGPYGAIYNNKWVIKRTKNDPGIYRGCIDLLPDVAKNLLHNGFEEVEVTTFKN